MDAARRRLLGLGILLVSLVVFLWGAWPAGRGLREVKISPVLLQPPGLRPVAGAEETARLKFEWPQRLRTGDSQTVRLDLELGAPDGSGAAKAERLDGYNRLVDAHLELEGMLPDPDGEITAPLKPGDPSLLEWTLHPRRAGSFTGTLWVHIRFIPQAGGSGTEEVRRVLTAQRMEFRSTSLLGLDGKLARLAGISGVIAGMMIFVETFLEGFWHR